jgi:hypothetical protein
MGTFHRHVDPAHHAPRPRAHAEALGDAVEILTRRSHRTGSIPVTAVTVARRGAREGTGVGLLPLCGTTPRRDG